MMLFIVKHFKGGTMCMALLNIEHYLYGAFYCGALCIWHYLLWDTVFNYSTVFGDTEQHRRCIIRGNSNVSPKRSVLENAEANHSWMMVSWWSGPDAKDGKANKSRQRSHLWVTGFIGLIWLWLCLISILLICSGCSVVILCGPA